jgi:hypothetical protein
MADNRIERARLRLSGDIGRDPNANIDATELCWVDATGIDSNSCGATPFRKFFAADFPHWKEDDKWFQAQEGLDAVRKLLAYYERIVHSKNDPLGREIAVVEEKISLLQEVANVLAAAAEAEADISFQIAVGE